MTEDKDKKEDRGPHLHVRVEQEEIDAYKLAAERDGRSLSSWVKRVLNVAVVQQSGKG